MDETPLLRVVAAGDTHIGRRDHNEDAILVRRELGLFVLADGAGGENAGNVASSLATSTIAHELEQSSGARSGFDRLGLPHGARQLSSAVHAANAQIVELSSGSSRLDGMATTVVAMLIDREVGVMHLAHVGDSRCYRLRASQVELLTQDHSLANDVLELVPDLSDERAASLPSRVITRALGMAKKVRVALQSHALVPGDRYLLCSDGLTDRLDEEQIADALRQSVRPPALVKLLLDIADAANGHDNSAVVIVDIHSLSDLDWPSPLLRGRPLVRAEEAPAPELFVGEDSTVLELDGIDEPELEFTEPVQDTKDASDHTLVDEEPPGRVAAVQLLMAEFPSIGHSERDPTMRFQRSCPSCGSLYDGKKNSCPNCWKD